MKDISPLSEVNADQSSAKPACHQLGRAAEQSPVVPTLANRNSTTQCPKTYPNKTGQNSTSYTLL